MIATLKIGYKLSMLSRLLEICHEPVAFAEAQRLAAHQKGGCKGLAYGCKPHLLDAMEICHELWNSADGKYSNTDSILRCWRKANCLPTLHQIEMNDSVTHRDRSERQIELNALDELCSSMEALSTKIKEMPTVPTFAIGTILVDDAIPSITLTDGLSYWCNVEDEQLVIEAEVEEQIDLIENETEQQVSPSATPISDSITVMEEDSPMFTDIDVDNMLSGLMSWVHSKGLDDTQRALSKVTRDIMKYRHQRPKVQSSLNMFFAPSSA